jgi:hypothetical protein
MATKRHKKHKNQISGLVISMCHNEQKSKFRLFTNPSIMENELWGFRVKGEGIDAVLRVYHWGYVSEAN